jgi:hypothetical protein
MRLRFAFFKPPAGSVHSYFGKSERKQKMTKMGRPRTSDDQKKILGTWRADRHAKPRQSAAPKGAGAAKRHSKVEDLEEAKLWSELFTSGYDHFDNYSDLGFPHQYAMNLAAGDAWRRLGQLYTAEILPTLGRPPALMTWALSTFGRPWLAHGTPWELSESP